jgi:hypothetical protein
MRRRKCEKGDAPGKVHNVDSTENLSGTTILNQVGGK